MSELSDKVVAAKSALAASLGQNVQRYFDYLKSWFGGKWSQEEFDFECRKLLTPDSVHLHNQFFIAMLNKIDALRLPQSTSSNAGSTSTIPCRTSRKRKRSSRAGVDRVVYDPYDLYEFLPDDTVEIIRQPCMSDDQPPSMPKYCIQEYFLPDIGFILGRMMVGAWEYGLASVDDDVAEYVVAAVQMLLKNIISAVILKRKQYKLTSGGNYYYDVGSSCPGPFVRNRATRHNVCDEKNLPERFYNCRTEGSLFGKRGSARSTLFDEKNLCEKPIDENGVKSIGTEKLRDEENYFSACEQLFPVQKTLITVNDVYKILRDRNILMSHTVFSINMERMSQMLH